MPDENKETIKVDMGGSQGVKNIGINCPSNAHSTIRDIKGQQQRPIKKIEKVTTGKVTIKKKSLGKKIAETFISEDADNIFVWMLSDILIPAAKATLTDMLHGSISMLFGEKRGGYYNLYNYRSTVKDQKPYVNYGGYSTQRRDERERIEISDRNRARHDFSDILFDYRDDAVDVLANLSDLIRQYDFASISDFYSLVGGIVGVFTDDNYGWYDLRGTRIIPVGSKYLIDLPRPVLLNQGG